MPQLCLLRSSRRPTRPNSIHTTVVGLALLVAASACKRDQPASDEAVADSVGDAGGGGASKEAKDNNNVEYTKSSLDVLAPERLDELGLDAADGEKVILFAGDVMPWDDRGGQMRTFSEGSVEYPYRGTAPMVQKADFAVGDLESPIAVRRGKRKKFIRFPYKMPPVVLDGVRGAGFDLVSLANNHIADYGTGAMLETIEHLEASKTNYIGLGANRDAAERIHVAQIGDAKVAFIACVSPETYLSNLKVANEPGAFGKRLKRMQDHVEARDDRAGSVLASVETVVRLVKQANELADLVVVYPHWGIRYHHSPSERQVEIAHAAIDAGADLIVGHHIHTWQPIEVYGGAIIAYGLGNFAFDSGNKKAADSIVVRAVLNGKRFDRVEIHPLATNNRDDAVRYQPKFMTGKSAAKVLTDLANASRERQAELEIVGDKAIVRIPPDVADAAGGGASSP